jgi:hypothetical protein
VGVTGVGAHDQTTGGDGRAGCSQGGGQGSAGCAQVEAQKEAMGASSERAKPEQQMRALRQQLQRVSAAAQARANHARARKASEGSAGVARDAVAGDADGDGQVEQDDVELDANSGRLERLLLMDANPSCSGSDADAAAERHLISTLTRLLQTPAADTASRQSLLAVLAGERALNPTATGQLGGRGCRHGRTRLPPAGRFEQGPPSIRYTASSGRTLFGSETPLLGERAFSSTAGASP